MHDSHKSAVSANSKWQWGITQKPHTRMQTSHATVHAASTCTDATCMCECMHACLRICSRTGATSHIPCRLRKYEGQAMICMSATVYLPKSSIHLPAESVWPSHVYVCQRAFIYPWLHLLTRIYHLLTSRTYVARQCVSISACICICMLIIHLPAGSMWPGPLDSRC